MTAHCFNKPQVREWSVDTHGCRALKEREHETNCTCCVQDFNQVVKPYGTHISLLPHLCWCKNWQTSQALKEKIKFLMFIFPWKSFTKRNRLHRGENTFFNHCLFAELKSEASISSTAYLFVLIILQNIYLLLKKDHNPWILLRTLLGDAVYEESPQSTSAADDVLSVLILPILCSNKYKTYLLNVQIFERLSITCNGKKRGLVSQRADKNIPMSLKQHCRTQGRKKKIPHLSI